MKNDALELVKVLLYNSIQVNVINQDGHSPLSLALKGKNLKTLEEPRTSRKDIYHYLIANGADVNIIYPEDSHSKQKRRKNQLNAKQTDNQSAEDKVDEGQYMCTFLINYIRHSNH